MAIRKRGRTPLACAVWLGLFAAPQVMAQTWWVTDGTTSTVDGQTYDSGIVANIDGAAVRVENAGSKAVGTNITVKTGGENAPGVVARSGGEVDLTVFTVTTTADFARGAFVDGGELSLRNGSIATDGLQAWGIDLLQSSNATIENADVTAQRAVAARVDSGSALKVTNSTLTGTTGIAVTNTGSTVTTRDVDIVSLTSNGVLASFARATLAGGSVTAQGAGGNGLYAEVAASIVAKDGIVVTTRGGAAANARSGASITLDDATLRTTEGGAGIVADGAGTVVDANAVTIEANGMGVRALNGSQVTLAGTNVRSETYGIDAFRATVEVSGGSVAAAAGEWGIAGNEASISLNGGASVSSRSTHAVVMQDGTLEVDNATLRSIETGSGLVITGASANVANARIESVSQVAVSVLAGHSVDKTSTLALTNTDVDAGSSAIAVNSRDGYGAHVSVSGGNLRAASSVVTGTATADRSASTLLLSNGVQLQSGTGVLIDLLNDALLVTTLDNVDLDGRLQAAGNAVLDVAFRNTATLDGVVAHGGAFDLATGTSWSLPGDSDVGSLINAGAIAFNDPTAFHTLTVRGDYTGTGGLIALNTQLADDVANSDRLHVIGDTSGSTQLAITNRGGAGALTNADGIRVVQVDGASDGTFALTGRVVGGAYDYLLHQGGVADPSDGDWYLRSALTPPPPVDPPPVDPPPVDPPPVDPPPVDPPPVDPPPVDPPPVDPPPVDPPPVDPPPVDPPPVDPPPVDPPPVDPPPVDPPPVDPPPTEPPPHVDPVRPPHAPVYRPEVGAYLANQQAAQTVFRQRRDDRGVSRIGGIERTAWVRALHNDHRGITGGAQIETEAQANGIEIGSQFGAWEVGEGLVSVGASLGRADIGTREVSNATHYFAFGDVSGDAVTAFATWLGDADSPHGLSLDMWVQRGDFEMEVRGQGLAIERYDARATSVSLETGYAFKVVGMVDRALYFEPQFQVVHTDYDMDAHVEANGTVVRSAEDGGLAGRVALRLFGDIVGMRPFVEIGARYNDTRQAIAFDGAVLDLDLAPVVYETTGGLSVEFGEGWRAWGSVSGRRADTTREVEGQFGVGYRW